MSRISDGVSAVLVVAGTLMVSSTTAWAACDIGAPAPAATMFVVEAERGGLRDQTAQAIVRRIVAADLPGPALVRTLGARRIVVQLPDGAPGAAFFAHGALGFHRVLAVGDDVASAGPGELVARGMEDGTRYLLDGEPVVTGAHLQDAALAFSAYSGEPVINFRFDGEGAARFADFTAQHIGEPFAIVLDGEVVSAPRIQTPILGGAGYIEGNFNVEEAGGLAVVLRGGTLPAPVQLLEERAVGALARNGATAGPAVLIELALPPDVDLPELCRRLTTLAPGDVSIQLAPDPATGVLVWLATGDSVVPDSRTVGAIAGKETRVRRVEHVGPDLASGAGGIFGRIRRIFD